MNHLQMAQYMLLAQRSEKSSEQFDHHECDAFEFDLPFRPQMSFCRRNIKLVIFHSLLCTFYIVSCLAIWHWAGKDCSFGVHGPDFVYSMLDP